MRVILNVESGTGQRTGVGVYADCLLANLRKLSTEDTFDCFPGEWVRQAYDGWGRLNRATPGSQTSMARSSPWRAAVARALVGPLDVARRMRFRRQCRRGQYDLYHEPNFVPLAMEVPTVTTVHDISLSVHPEWHPEDRRVWWESQFIPSLSRCAHVITVSDFVKSQVEQFLGVSPDKVTRVYQGIRDAFVPLEAVQVERVRQRLGLPSRYLLHVGAIQPRKNLLMLMEAYSALPGEVRERHPLVLAGPWGWKADAVGEFFDRRGRMSGIHHMGYIDDCDLPALYNGAHALVYPSLHEGFGLPPLEMMACGGAVVASSAGALMETIGENAPLVDPRDADAWRQALLRVCTDMDWWRHLRSGAREWATRYSWERSASETLKVYGSVLGKGVGC